MPGRKFNGGDYRYGFTGKENDNEIKGDGNSVDFGARMYDPRIGRWFAVDKLSHKYPDQTPYHYAINSPIQYKDIDGRLLVDPDGNPIYTEKGKFSLVVSGLFKGLWGMFRHVDRRAYYANDGSRNTCGC